MHLKLVLPLFLVLIIINSATTDTILKIRLSAKELDTNDLERSSAYDPDPFVEVYYAKSEFDNLVKKGETKYIDNELNPIWDEAFEVTLHGRDVPNPSAEILKIQIWDYDLSSANDFYGNVTVRLNTLALCAKNAPSNGCNKDGKSVLCFDVKLNPTSGDIGLRYESICVPIKRKEDNEIVKIYDFNK